MRIQKIFKAGNSNVVAIPKDLAAQLGLEEGQKVRVEEVPNKSAVLVEKVKESEDFILHDAPQAAEEEYQKWLKVFLDENGEILDELAVR